MLARMTITDYTNNEALMIPSDAVLRDRNNLSYVFVARNENGALVARRMDVAVVESFNGWAEIKLVNGGLEAGNAVVVKGARGLSEGRFLTYNIKTMSNLDNFRQFGLSIWSIGNRKTVFLIMAVIFFGGYVAYISMPKENFPELQIPEIYIGIAKPGSSPQYMADKIIRPIEKELATIKKVDEINSDGIHGYATIRVKFDFSVNVQQALQKVKDAVDKATLQI